MAGGSFSLTEKLAVTGAFLALVAMVVGTKDDPGVVVTGQQAVKELGAAKLAGDPAAASADWPSSETQPLEPSSLPQSEVLDAAPPTFPTDNEGEDNDGQFDPELGRVPIDLSNGPPVT